MILPTAKATESGVGASVGFVEVTCDTSNGDAGRGDKK